MGRLHYITIRTSLGEFTFRALKRRNNVNAQYGDDLLAACVVAGDEVTTSLRRPNVHDEFKISAFVSMPCRGL